jgi:hypothetical protein
MNVLRRLIAPVLAWTPTLAFATDQMSQTRESFGSAGVSGLWVLANISYAGMKAQSNPSTGWRVVSFIFGFPGTLISFFVVNEGGERAYGIDCPRKR